MTLKPIKAKDIEQNFKFYMYRGTSMYLHEIYSVNMYSVRVWCIDPTAPPLLAEPFELCTQDILNNEKYYGKMEIDS